MDKIFTVLPNDYLNFSKSLSRTYISTFISASIRDVYYDVYYVVSMLSKKQRVRGGTIFSKNFERSSIKKI